MLKRLTVLFGMERSVAASLEPPKQCFFTLLSNPPRADNFAEQNLLNRVNQNALITGEKNMNENIARIITEKTMAINLKLFLYFCITI